jgi:hypothetical protein
MPLGPMKRFKYRGKTYARCKGCGMVGYVGWTHMHGTDVDGHEYGVNWYRSVSELEHRLKEGRVPPGTILRGTRT